MHPPEVKSKKIIRLTYVVEEQKGTEVSISVKSTESNDADETIFSFSLYSTQCLIQVKSMSNKVFTRSMADSYTYKQKT